VQAGAFLEVFLAFENIRSVVDWAFGVFGSNELRGHGFCEDLF